MFEAMTYENILKRCLDRVDDGLDKREGSIIYDALAPACAELAQLYISFEGLLSEAFAKTASFDYLKLMGEERGLYPEEASFAEGIGEFNVDIGEGVRFSIDSFNWVSVKAYEGENDSGYFWYYMQCENAGSAPNGYTGRLIPIETIPGLSHSLLLRITVPGDEAEDVESFRKRYFESIDTSAFGGNIADYKAKVKAIDGVGGVRVYRADDWNGAGTVRLVISTSENKSPEEEFIQSLQESIDPMQAQAEGYGIAPIGHQVTVEGVKTAAVSVAGHFIMQEGYSFENVKTSAETAVKAYIEELNSLWESENVTLYWTRILMALMNVEGIKSVEDIEINGEREVNLSLGADYVAELSEVKSDG